MKTLGQVPSLSWLPPPGDSTDDSTVRDFRLKAEATEFPEATEVLGDLR